MATPPLSDVVTPTWTLDELLAVLGKLPVLDLARFLKTTYPDEDLESWEHEDLLALALEVLQSWETVAASPADSLIQATSAVCRASFEAFVRMFWDEVPVAQPLMWNWHLGVFTENLQEVAECIFRHDTRPHDLICNVSPNTSKSSVWSVLFPCWVWTRMPEARLITASHTDQLVTDLAAYARDVMRKDMYRLCFPEIEFTETQDAKGYYRNTRGGERFTCTVAGKSPTGKHAHFIIVDDPIDPKKVLSEAERKTAGDFLTQVIPSRRMRGARGDICATMLVMQRLGIDDPTDVLLNIAKRSGSAPVKHICLPAEITEDISPPELTRYYTEFNIDAGVPSQGLMDPIRLSRKTLDEQHAILLDWGYAGQYLQKPRPPAGGMFKEKWFTQREPSAPLRAKRIRYWDRASSTTESACFTAGVLMCLTDDGKFFIEDVVHIKAEPDERNETILSTAMRDRNRYGKYEPTIYIEHEPAASGKETWQSLARKLMGFAVREDVVKGSKDVRAESLVTQFSAMNVWLVDNGENKKIGKSSWDIDGYVKEFVNFRPEPGKRLGRYKDRVDATTGAFNLLVKNRRPYLPLYTYNITPAKKNQGRWLIACAFDELGMVDLSEQRTLVVVFNDPEPPPQVIDGGVVNEAAANPPLIIANKDGTGAAGSTNSLPAGGMPATIHEGSRNLLPPPSIPQNIGLLELKCADLDPADYQVNYGLPVEPWHKPVEDLQLSREQAKKFWAHTLKKYDAPWQVLVIVDQGGQDRRALSAAMAVADMLRLPRTAIYLPSVESKDEMVEDDAPNPWIFEQLRSTKHMIVT